MFLGKYDHLNFSECGEGKTKHAGKCLVPNKHYPSTKKDKKRMVLVKKGDKTKLVHYGQKGYRHNYSKDAKKSYLARSGGIRNKSGELTKNDPFSPNYHARRQLWPQNKKADGKAKFSFEPSNSIEFAKKEKEVKVSAYRTRKGKRVNPFRRRQKVKNDNSKIIAGSSALVLGAGILANSKFKITDKAILGASKLAYLDINRGISGQIINKALMSQQVPNKVKTSIRKMTGASKVFLAQTIFKKREYELIDTDDINNFSTWKKPDGSLLSVGSINENVFEFSSKKEKYDRFGIPNYHMSFKVNENYSKSKNVNTSDGLKIIRNINELYNKHSTLIPNNSLLTAEVWTSDTLGEKRASLYQRKGFKGFPELQDPYYKKGDPFTVFAIKKDNKVQSFEDAELKKKLGTYD
jgi:hypothetical protein